MENRITEVKIFRWMVVILLFILLAFNRDLGIVYMVMILADYVWWSTDRSVSIETERVNKRAESMFLALAAYMVFFIANIVVGMIFQTGGGLQSIFTQLSSTTPVLQGSNILSLIGWGIFIPLIETRFFFGRLFEGSLEIVGANLSRLSLQGKTLIVMLMISAVFALFHITSKNLENVPLIMTFIFAFISCWLVIKEKQLMSAVLFHIFTNTTAVLYLWRPEVFSALGLM